jgi:amino acid efflux transporter
LIAGGSLAAVAASGSNAEDILFIPAALVVATYLMSMAAGARLLSGGARLTALIALLPCIVVLFYLGTRILVPVLVGIVALGQWKRRSTVTERRLAVLQAGTAAKPSYRPLTRRSAASGKVA